MPVGTVSIKDFQFIDKEKSEIDEKKSNPEKGLYHCVEGKRVPYRFKLRDGKPAPYWFHWAHNEPTRISSLKIRKGYIEVTRDDKIVPEGMIISTQGHYEFGDLVLMRCSLEQYLNRRIYSRKKSDVQLRATVNEFRDKTKKHHASIDKELLDEILEDITSDF